MTEISAAVEEQDVGVHVLPYAPPPRHPVVRALGAFYNSRAVWALADQGVVSASNFATTLLLGRFLGSDAMFGFYGVLMEALMFLNSLQAALVIYPLSVRGAKLDNESLRIFVGQCLRLTAVFALPLAIVIAATTFVLGIPGVAIAIALALITWQIHEMLRRALISRMRLREAILGDIIRYGGLLGATALLAWTSHLSLSNFFSVMTLVSVIGIVVQVIQIGPRSDNAGELPRILREFWHIGRWALCASMTALVSTVAVTWTLLLSHGEESVAAYTALANLVKISHPMMFSVMALITPAVAWALHNHGLAHAARTSARYALLGLLALLPFYLLLLIVPQHVISLAYGSKSTFTQLGHELRIFCVWYAVIYCTNIMSAHLNGLEHSRHGFFAQLAQMTVAAVITIPLTAIYGLNGLLIGGLISALAMGASLVFFLRKVHTADEPAA